MGVLKPIDGMLGLLVSDQGILGTQPSLQETGTFLISPRATIIYAIYPRDCGSFLFSSFWESPFVHMETLLLSLLMKSVQNIPLIPRKAPDFSILPKGIDIYPFS